MDENEDEFETIIFDQETTNVALEWAVATAAMIIMAYDQPVPTTPEHMAARLEQLEEMLQSMHGSIPDFMYDFANAFAYKVMEEADAEEAMIEQFKKELDDL